MDDKDVDELQRIWDLKEKGAISEEEYAQLKSRILGQRKPTTDRVVTETQLQPRQSYRTNQPAKVDLNAPRPSYQKIAGIGCLSLLGLFIVLAALGGSKNTGANSVAENTTGPTAGGIPEDTNKAADYKAMLKREIASMRAEPGSASIEPTKEAVMASALLIGTRAKAYEESAPASLDAETKALRAEYKRLAIKYQVAAFPRIRAA